MFDLHVKNAWLKKTKSSHQPAFCFICYVYTQKFVILSLYFLVFWGIFYPVAPLLFFLCGVKMLLFALLPELRPDQWVLYAKTSPSSRAGYGGGPHSPVPAPVQPPVLSTTPNPVDAFMCLLEVALLKSVLKIQGKWIQILALLHIVANLPLNKGIVLFNISLFF